MQPSNHQSGLFVEIQKLPVVVFLRKDSLSCILLSINREAYCNNRQRLFEMSTKSKWQRNNQTQIPFFNNETAWERDRHNVST